MRLRLKQGSWGKSGHAYGFVRSEPTGDTPFDLEELVETDLYLLRSYVEDMLAAIYEDDMKNDRVKAMAEHWFKRKQKAGEAMDLSKVRPLGDRVTLRELKRAEKIGSIFIPDTASDQAPARRAEILAVGPGAVVDGKLVEPRVKAGETVLFGKYSGTEIEVDGEKIIVCREEDLLGVVEG